MSYSESAIMETKVLIDEKRDSIENPTPVLVSAPRADFTDWVARRIDAVLDYICGNGAVS
jgi:hypothetical protein